MTQSFERDRKRVPNIWNWFLTCFFIINTWPEMRKQTFPCHVTNQNYFDESAREGFYVKLQKSPSHQTQFSPPCLSWSIRKYGSIGSLNSFSFLETGLQQYNAYALLSIGTHAVTFFHSYVYYIDRLSSAFLEARLQQHVAYSHSQSGVCYETVYTLNCRGVIAARSCEL